MMIVDCSVCHCLYNTNEGFYLTNCAHVLCTKHQKESIDYCAKCHKPNVKAMPLTNFKVNTTNHEVDVDLSDNTLNKDNSCINNFFVDITTQLEDFYGISKFQIMNLKERCHYLTNKNVELTKQNHTYESMINDLTSQLKNFDELHNKYQLLLQRHHQSEREESNKSLTQNFVKNVKESVGLLSNPQGRYPTHNHYSNDMYKNNEIEVNEESSRYEPKQGYRSIKNSHVPMYETSSSEHLKATMKITNGNYLPTKTTKYLDYYGHIPHEPLIPKSNNSRLSSGYYHSKNGSSSKLSVGRGIGGRKGIFSHRKESK
ncbi:hypothetical protein ACO0R3_001571 [Hanseniaspora guilliermondii]